MMLRASIPAAPNHPRVELLAQLVDAVIGPDEAAADAARRVVAAELGADWLVDACAVIANFEMMTRLADGTGARMRPQQLEAAAPVIESLGLASFTSARG